jgi:hypothetical protein
MTTSYKEPRIEIEQQFTATASSTYLPELRACIVAPFYDMVEEESVGTYANVEEEYNWASVRPVDVRTGTNADELTYPLTVTLKEAVTQTVDHTAPGAGTAVTSGFTFTSTTDVFTYPNPEEYDTFVQFAAAAYTHAAGASTVTADGILCECTVVGSIAIPGVLPAAVAQGGGAVTGSLTAVYATTDGDPLTTGDFPTTCYLKITPGVGTFAAGALDGGYAGITIVTATNRYTATSTIPRFYTGLDYSNAVPTTITVATTVPPAAMTGTVYRQNSTTSLEFTSAELAPVTGDVDTTTIERATLTAAEIAEVREVRSISSTKVCRLSVMRAGVIYSAITFDVFEWREYSVDINDFSDWGITTLATGVRLPFNLVTPGTSFPVTAADVYLTYRALRTDLEDELEYYETVADLETEFGTTTKYNTGAYMTYLALANANGRPIYVTGLGEDFYTNATTAFTSALSYLEDKRVYALACASMLPAVHTRVNAHVNLCSTAEQGSWRIGINCHTLAEYETLVASATTGAGYVDIYREGFTGDRLVMDGATWAASGVSAGDSIYITGWGDIEPAEIFEATIVAGAVNVTGGTWDSADTTISVAGVTLPGGYTAADFRGRTVKMTYGVANFDTSTDTASEYSDHTRTAPITTQSYAELGYKVISALLDGTTLTLHLYTVDAQPTGGSPDGQVMNTLKVYDGPLSESEENAIKNNYIEIGTVDSDEILLATFKARYYGIYTNVVHQIRKQYDRDEMAENYAAYTSSFDNRRMNFVFPHVYQDSEGTQMNGYFIAAAEAGWIGGAYAHQSITSQNLQGFYRLLYANKYFKKSQLNEIAGGGVTIYTQEVDNAGITCRHQLTTDLESILTQENSITRSVDTGAYMLLDALNPLKGRYNIVDDLYTVINTKVNAVRGLLCEKKYSRYGSILKKFEVKSLIQDPNAQDGLYLEIECETQKPFNRATVLIKVS